ncbi:MAG: hypothetical protein IT175_00610 [Acidobacteria bacterium]|nr:hypothetical protein [Acidobacteriota bacterium]
MFDQLSTPKSRFPIILVGSVALHSGMLGLLFVGWVWGIALKFGELRFEDGGESTVKVAMLDRSKPLYMPPGFYAIAKPPEKVEKPADPDEQAGKADEKDAPKASDEDGRKDGAEDGEKKGEDPKPVGQPKFGVMGGGPLKPHLKQIYEAHERGLIAADNFTVTVTCRALADGSLADIRIAQSSGERLIDETAVNILKEISNQHALAPLSTLSSLSLTLQKDSSTTALSAVGFSEDPDRSATMARELGLVKTLSRFKMKNDDQMELLNSVQISQSGNRVTVRAELPNSKAGDMMTRSFGSTARAGT